MIGPRKQTLLAQTLARILNVPFCIADATNDWEDVENIIVNLLQAADHDVDKAQRGIIYIDESTKLVVRVTTPRSRAMSAVKVFNRLCSKLLKGPQRACHRKVGENIPNKFLQVGNQYPFICGDILRT